MKFIRGNTGGVAIEMSLDNATWPDAGGFFKSPANVVGPGEPGKSPRAVALRALYVEGDSPFSQFPHIVTTASQPSAQVGALTIGEEATTSTAAFSLHI